MQKIMNKIAILLLLAVCLCSSIGFTACGKEEENIIEQSGESKVLETDVAPNNLDLVEKVAYVLIGKLNEFSTYIAEAEGTTEASIVTQKIKSKIIKHDSEYYTENYSESTFVHTRHCAFFKGGKVVYNPKGLTAENLNVVEESDYKKVYGVVPCDNTFFGYVINEDTVKSAEKVLEEGDELTYKFVLDGNKAGVNVKVQMKEFGGLNGYPTFTETVLLVTLKKDWTPLTVKINCKYNVSFPLLGNIPCKQDLTWKFTSVNKEVEIPYSTAFNEKIG